MGSRRFSWPAGMPLRYVRAMQRRPLIAGNWKMHKLPSEGVHWAGDFLAGLEPLQPLHCDVALMVPFTHLHGMARVTFGTSVALGSQDVSAHEQGAYTGEVSAAMVADTGAAYAVVGHSERRQYHHEDDATVREKVKRAAAAGLVPVLCVGETREQRDAGRAMEVVLGQLRGALQGVEVPSPDRLVVAYEPVWAIGTGLTATAGDAQEMCAAVRGELRALVPGGDAVRVLYGGSMKPDNAGDLLAQPDVDGGLVGGASLSTDDLLAIVAACDPGRKR